MRARETVVWVLALTIILVAVTAVVFKVVTG